MLVGYCYDELGADFTSLVLPRRNGSPSSFVGPPHLQPRSWGSDVRLSLSYCLALGQNVDSFTRHLPVSQALQHYFAQCSKIVRRMASDPPLKGLRVLELAGLAPGALFNRNPQLNTCGMHFPLLKSHYSPQHPLNSPSPLQDHFAASSSPHTAPPSSASIAPPRTPPRTSSPPTNPPSPWTSNLPPRSPSSSPSSPPPTSSSTPSAPACSRNLASTRPPPSSS
jgi:hypothetical protein